MNASHYYGYWIAGVATLALTSSAHAYEVDIKNHTAKLSSLDDFERCSSESFADYCLDGLNAYAKAHPKESFAAGKHARLHFNHWVALRFFDLAPIAPEQCSDPDLGLAVVSGLALPGEDPNFTLAKKVADSPCWPSLQSRVQKELKDGSALYTKNACTLLSKKNLHPAECSPREADKPAPPSAAVSARVANIDPHRVRLDADSIMQFHGPETEEVLFAYGSGDDEHLALIKLKGIRGPWKNRVVVAVEDPQSDGDKNFVANVDGHDWIVLATDYGDWKVYPKGYENGIHLVRDRETRKSSPELLREITNAK